MTTPLTTERTSIDQSLLYPLRCKRLILRGFEVVEVWGFEPQAFSLRTTIGHFGKKRQRLENVGTICSEPA